MGTLWLPFTPFGNAAGTSLVHQAAFCLLTPRTSFYPRLRLILSLCAQGDGSVAVYGVHVRFLRVLHASVYRILFRCNAEGKQTFRRLPQQSPPHMLPYPALEYRYICPGRQRWAAAGSHRHLLSAKFLTLHVN